VPGIPLSVASAQATTTTAKLTWATPAFAGTSAITGFRVTRVGVDSAGKGSYTSTVSASTKTLTMTKLVKGKTYTFTVTAINSVGFGPVATTHVTIK
jgi:hypothetical protein